MINKCIGIGCFDTPHFNVTAIHSIAGNVLRAGKIPILLDHERKALEADLQKAALPRVDGGGDAQQA